MVVWEKDENKFLFAVSVQEKGESMNEFVDIGDGWQYRHSEPYHFSQSQTPEDLGNFFRTFFSY
ncbi:MAG: hypothetical protein V1898_00090 [Patescibacteria group bacterium]